MQTCGVMEMFCGSVLSSGDATLVAVLAGTANLAVMSVDLLQGRSGGEGAVLIFE